LIGRGAQLTLWTMRRLLLGFLLSIGVSAAAATPVIKEFGPVTIPVGSGERYLGIRGSHFTSGAHGPVVLYSGPAGEFAVTPSSLWGFEPDVRMQVWVPAEIVYTVGRYSVVVRNAATGDSDPVHFDVTGEAQIVLRVPSSVLVEATGPSGAVATYEVSAESTTGAPVDVSCSHASGSTFPIGATSVRCTATMADGSARSANFIVSVVDRTPPLLTVPQDLTREATESEGTVVHFETAATDIADLEVTVRCAPASGSLFRIGTTEVRCTATDDSLNATVRGFRVTVTSLPLPRLMLPEDLTVPATSAEGAVVTFTATAVDFAERIIPAVCTPETGSVFPVGTTTVSCTATDYEHGASHGTFRVTVTEAPEEEPPPALLLPADITAEASTPDGTRVTFTATAHDETDGELAVACAPASGATFPIGTTVVTCSATNSRGITATGTFQVTVADTIPPEIVSIRATPDLLWPANKRLVDVVVSVTAADDGDPMPAARITGVIVSEHAQPSDWNIVDDLTVALRADRNGKEKPRVYTIVVEVSDASGNIGTATVDVTVPHDEGTDNATKPPVRRRRAVRH
jgi:hypothetical protein